MLPKQCFRDEAVSLRDLNFLLTETDTKHRETISHFVLLFGCRANFLVVTCATLNVMLAVEQIFPLWAMLRFENGGTELKCVAILFIFCYSTVFEHVVGLFEEVSQPGFIVLEHV